MPLPHADIAARLDFVLGLYPAAAKFVLGYYETGSLAVEWKADQTPVTLADRGAEELLRKHLSARFPQDAILGEESGETPGTSGFRWVLDPVDGTKSFVSGVPLFGMLIGLQFHSECVAGVCGFPALNEVVYARRGEGTWRKCGDAAPVRCQVRQCPELSQAVFCFTSSGGWDSAGHWETFAHLTRATRLSRGWGDCYGHVLVATGRADVMVDPALAVWDAAALIPIVTEAGGHFIDWTGQQTVDGGNGISVIPELRSEVLRIIQDPSAQFEVKRGLD
jgi:histidinol-phosphatase